MRKDLLHQYFEQKATYRHKKSGNGYIKLYRANDCTNSHGKLVPVVVYAGMDGQIWVREEKEFEENFECLT